MDDASAAARGDGVPTRRMSEWVADVLDRPQVILAIVPLGALYVGIVDLLVSRGFAGTWGLIGFLLVAIAYLAQSLLVLLVPRWVQPGYATVVISLSSFSTLMFQPFLVEPRSALYWFWLLGPVIMIGGYLCRAWQLGLVTCVCTVSALVFLARDGRVGVADAGLVLLALGVLYLPALLTVQVLGSLRAMERMVQEQSWQDPLTSVLNRHGLDQEFNALVGSLDHTETISVLTVDIDNLKEINDSLGHFVGDQVLVRVASVISRAYRRDHLVGRVTGNGFVVVTHHDPRQLAAAILQAVRTAQPGERRLDPPAERWGDRRIEVSVGALRGIPRSAAAPGRLSGAVMLAERAAQRARSLGSDRSVIEDYDADVGLPGPVGLQRRAGSERPRAARDVPRQVADTRILGLSLVAMGLAFVLVPRHPAASETALTGLVLGCVLLAGVGSWIALTPRPATWLAIPSLLVAVLCAQLTLVTSAGVPATLLLLLLAAYPTFAAALLLETPVAVGFTALLPVAIYVSLTFGPAHVPGRDVLAVTAIGLLLLTSFLALWVRRQRDVAADELQRLSLLDPLTGLATRRGLLSSYRALAPGTEVVVMFLDVDHLKEVNERYGHSGGDVALRNVATILADLAGRTGTAARVGSDEFVLLLPGNVRVSTVRRSLTLRLAVTDPQVTVSAGQAHGVCDTDGSLWRMMSMADESLLLRRSRERAAPGSR
ncbi:diguanylate cyclase [Arsenicicoccus piscis]|nr:sensor domain-containing diguanylate cyclase [Arsenicicoccus piscis]MCH8627744.1 diguanylate cyclase [Arsenicicoccus piscis]